MKTAEKDESYRKGEGCMKAYVKPDLVYENFELSENIAACGWDLNQNSKDVCVAAGDPNFGNSGNLFIANIACTITPDMLETYCYEVSTTGNNVFQS
ncbi:MAG: hypothetical protein PUA83_04365 [Clostridiales bacterium]|nr:hypothetical protein [Clostridiales bacterium]